MNTVGGEELETRAPSVDMAVPPSIPPEPEVDIDAAVGAK